jgi:peptidoglycan hydrolase-like protein with peptidoglycan-binding domain
MTTYPNPTKSQILAAFDRFGVRYKVEPVVAGSEGRSWSSGLRALIDHHTAGSNSLGYLKNAGGTYPLVNSLIDKDGLVHILSTRSCWGTGDGGPWPGVAGKDSLHLVGWSTEVESLGQKQDFTTAQLESLGRQNAALISLGVPAAHEINHRDWTDGTGGVSSSPLPTAGRKVDTRYDTTFLRQNTAAYLNGTPPPPSGGGSTTPPPSSSYRQGKKVYSSKMKKGQANSDSVWNLTVALKITKTDDYTQAVVDAVAAFQRKQGWSGSGADGIAGPETVKRLGLTWVDDGKPPSSGGSSGPSYSYRQGKKVYSSKMKYGQQNSDSVWNLQVALISKGYKIPDGPTDNYGSQTKSACAAFQRAQGWSGTGADGIAGPETIKRLGLTWVNG